jgi:hypothetical protein
MTSEYWFNSQVLRNTFHKKQPSGVQPLHGRRKEIADAQRVQEDSERIYGQADGPENGADHESEAQIDALVAEEGCQRFGVGLHP